MQPAPLRVWAAERDAEGRIVRACSLSFEAMAVLTVAAYLGARDGVLETTWGELAARLRTRLATARRHACALDEELLGLGYPPFVLARVSGVCVRVALPPVSFGFAERARHAWSLRNGTPGLSLRAVAVHALLLDHAHGTSRCFPSQELLGARLGPSHRALAAARRACRPAPVGADLATVAGAIGELEDAGLVGKESRPGSNGRSRYEYRLLTPQRVSSTPIIGRSAEPQPRPRSSVGPTPIIGRTDPDHRSERTPIIGRHESDLSKKILEQEGEEESGSLTIDLQRPARATVDAAPSSSSSDFDPLESREEQGDVRPEEVESAEDEFELASGIVEVDFDHVLESERWTQRDHAAIASMVRMRGPLWAPLFSQALVRRVLCAKWFLQDDSRRSPEFLLTNASASLRELRARAEADMREARADAEERERRALENALADRLRADQQQRAAAERLALARSKHPDAQSDAAAVAALGRDEQITALLDRRAELIGFFARELVGDPRSFVLLAVPSQVARVEDELAALGFRLRRTSFDERSTAPWRALAGARAPTTSTPETTREAMRLLGSRCLASKPEETTPATAG